MGGLLDELLKEEYKLGQEAKRDLESIGIELRSIHAHLRKVVEMPMGQLDATIKLWASDAMDLTCDMDHAAHKFALHLRAPASHLGCISKIKLKKATARFRRELATDMRSFQRRINDLQARRDMQFDTDTIDDPSILVNADYVPVDGEVIEDEVDKDDHEANQLVGLNMPVAELVNKILAEEEGQLKVTTIVGPAGVGKTTLAKQVYRVLQPRFECTAWVTALATEADDIQSTLSSILRQVSQQDRPNCGSSDVEETIGLIREALTDKRYFIVFDNIWASSSWDIIMHAFVQNSHTSAVLTTRRKVEVDEYVGDVYQLSPLSETGSTTLLHNRLFHSQDKISPELAEICGKCIEACGGIPSAIIAKASLFAKKPWTVMDCHAVHGPYDTKGILDAAYKELPPCLKPCLLYLSMLRKGYVISGENLVWMWLAEGFILETPGIAPKKVGESYLNELINRYLIEPVEVDAAGKALSCRAYNMVHDMIVSLSAENRFAAILDDNNDRPFPETVSGLSIQKRRNSQQSLPQAYHSHVRSLLASGDAASYMYETPLSRFQELRVLDLGGFDDFLQNKDLMGIGDLYFLKCLVLGSKWIAEIPKEIGNLLFLQTLDLRATSVTELPASVLLARQLKRLYVNSRTKIPDGIGKLEDLEEIGDMNVSKTELLEELRSLTKLILLRIAIWSWDYSYGDSVLEALVRLLAEGRIQTLSILTCCSLRFLYRLDAGLAPPSLQKLEISHNALVALPRWIFSLENLSFLSVEVHKLSQEIIDMLGQLQNLLVLSLTSKHAPEHNSRFGNRADGFRKLTGFHFASNAMGKLTKFEV
ncbi:disease resistance protein RGA5 [Lolium perenne]|uniref:disease resistance protein RGA5 n=1 Tax=Lolium perenne TaxID=4522 RepID=UPI003A9A2BE9